MNNEIFPVPEVLGNPAPRALWKEKEHATVHSYCIIYKASLGMFMKQHLLISYAKCIKSTGSCEGKAVSQKRAISAVCLKQPCCSHAEGEGQPLFGKQSS